MTASHTPATRPRSMIINGETTIGVRSPDDFAKQLERALATRPVIEQAKGVLVGATHCTADEAFTQLVSASQNSNIKLSLLAASIVSMASGRGVHNAQSRAVDAVIRSRWGDLSTD